jgi:hypothetical protein
MNSRFTATSAITTAAALTFSCASNPSQRRDEAAALATTSAMVAALPLIPVAALFRIVSGSEEKWKAKAEERRRVFDPLYRQRIEMIQARDPIADAQRALQSGSVAFLPSMPSGALYPGLEKTEFHLQDRDANLSAISQSELLRYLVDLMDRDKEHASGDGVFYTSEVWNAFLKVGWSYKARFNTEVYRLRTGKEPNKAPEPTPGPVTPHAGACVAPVPGVAHL